MDAGEFQFATSPSQRITHFAYDGLGRLVSERQQVGFDDATSGEPNDVTTQYAYAAAGNLLTVTDPLAHEANYEYDYLDRLVTETDALDNATSYAYDLAGRMTSLTDPEDNETTWTYDDHGWVATEVITVDSTPLAQRAIEQIGG